MGRKKVQTVVDDTRYVIEQLNTTEGLRIYNRLAHVLGDAINRELQAGPVLAADATPEERTAKMGERVVRMIVDSLERIPEDLQLSLGATFAKSCEFYAGEALMPLEPSYESHFAGRFLHWTMWLLECLKVNFADFLERAKRAAPTEDQTPSQ